MFYVYKAAKVYYLYGWKTIFSNMIFTNETKNAYNLITRYTLWNFHHVPIECTAQKNIKNQSEDSKF